MTEQEFLRQWQLEKSMYDAWGDLVVNSICSEIERSGYKLSSYLKQESKHRLKDDVSLIDKAFYRPDKQYENPYSDIEDKVGCRFVVLLVEQIEEIRQIIHNSDLWTFKECRHFDRERKKSPLLFTYQSVHYVVRAKEGIEHKGVVINQETPCEIQIRTLLQHAYAELTHDAVYKAKRLVEPEVHRTVAKSMALIETTDDFFSEVNQRLNSGAVNDFSFQSKLDSLYQEHVGFNPAEHQKSSLVILDEFENLVTDDLSSKLIKFVSKHSYIIDVIRENSSVYPFYRQSVVIFVYWLIKKKKHRLLDGWPLDKKILEKLAVDIGASIDWN